MSSVRIPKYDRFIPKRPSYDQIENNEYRIEQSCPSSSYSHLGEILPHHEGEFYERELRRVLQSPSVKEPLLHVSAKADSLKRLGADVSSSLMGSLAGPQSRNFDNFFFSSGELYSHPLFRHPRRFCPLPRKPDIVLDAPGMLDDFYLNLLDWSSDNLIAVALSESVYLWNASSHSIHHLLSANDVLIDDTSSFSLLHPSTSHRYYISSLKFLNSSHGHCLAVGFSNGVVQLWDYFSGQKIRQYNDTYQEGAEMMDQEINRLATSAHVSSTASDSSMILPSNRVAVMHATDALLSVGSRYSTIRNYDLRVGKGSGGEESVMSFSEGGHTQEVCGLEWNTSSFLLASGGNDNMVLVWDPRLSLKPLLGFNKHSAAVKALGWCPWKRNILASGGGSTDRQLCIWNASSSGSLVESLDTLSQVCCLRWSKCTLELFTGHGFAKNELILWAYPKLLKMDSLPAHKHRVLHMAISPDGSTLASAASDENIKLWKLFDSASSFPSPLRTSEAASNPFAAPSAVSSVQFPISSSSLVPSSPS